MVQLRCGLLAFFALSALAGLFVAGTANAQPPADGWALEQDVETPSYAVIEPASTDLNIDSIVLSCEQGPRRSGLQLRLYLTGAGPLAPRGAGALKADPTLEFAIDGVSHAVQLFFADDFVIVADSSDGVMPLLSDTLLNAVQAGRRMELRFDLVQEARRYAPSFDNIAVVNLQAGRGGAAVAAVRRCADQPKPQVAETPHRLRESSGVFRGLRGDY